MGCQSSKLSDLSQININVIDPTFMKSQNNTIRQKMLENNIKYQYFISLNCFIDQFTKKYTNQIVANIQNYHQVNNCLKKLNFYPNIYVITSIKIEENLSDNIYFIQSYQELINKFILKSKRKKSSKDFLKQLKNSKQKKLDLKIFKKTNTAQTSQQLIFESTLKSKNITYQIYQSFQQLQQSMYQKDSYFLITDYVYHKQVLNLVEGTKTKVICYCQLQKDQVYQPQTYMISNNFLEISSEIAWEISLKKYSVVHCSKIYVYTQNFPQIPEYVTVIESFNFQVRLVTDLQKLLKQTTFFFCVTILTVESQIKTIQKFLQKNEYQFKVKIVSITKQNEPSQIGLRKIIKQFKRGYRAQKGITNSIDIIDKHYNNIKFQQIKRQLDNNNINYYGFSNLSNYIKNKKFISPFIICNYQQRSLLIRYLKQIQSNSKVIIFCNKNKINYQFKQSKQFSFVSSHFGKIINFIQKNFVYKPIIMAQCQIKLNQKVQKLKNKNKRISAIKWCGIQQQNNQQDSFETQFQFLNVSYETNKSTILDLQKDAAILWKLDYQPFNNLQLFKNDLIDNLNKLKKIYKINYPQNQFKNMLDQIKIFTISKLINRVRQFFQSENQLGLNINKTLLNIQKINQNQIVCLRQIIFLMNLNFLSIYKSPKIDCIKLQHWISQPLLDQCQLGSYLLTKNYFIFYEQSTDINVMSRHKIVIEINYNTIQDDDQLINFFFKYKDKYIIAPYTQFRVKRINNTQLNKVIELEYVKNIQYLKYYYHENLLVHQKSLLKKFRQAIEEAKGQNYTMVDQNIINEVRLNLQRYQALKQYKSGLINSAIQLQKQTIKQEQQLQNLNSVKITQLNYQLACYYIKNNNYKQAGQLFKQILDSNPVKFIRQQCQKMIDQITTIKTQKNIHKNMDQLNSNNSNIYETFVKLKQNQGDINDNIIDDNSQNNSQLNICQTNMSKYQKQIQCLQIDDQIFEERICNRKCSSNKQNIQK